MTVRLQERKQDLPLSPYDWQTFITTRLERWPAGQVNVATVGKVRGVEKYLVLPALRYSEVCGHGHTFGTMREVRTHLRQAMALAVEPPKRTLRRVGKRKQLRETINVAA